MKILLWTASGSSTVTQNSGYDTIMFTKHPEPVKMTYTSIQTLPSTRGNNLYSTNQVSILSVTLLLGILVFKKCLKYSKIFGF